VPLCMPGCQLAPALEEASHTTVSTPRPWPPPSLPGNSPSPLPISLPSPPHPPPRLRPPPDPSCCMARGMPLARPGTCPLPPPPAPAQCTTAAGAATLRPPLQAPLAPRAAPPQGLCSHRCTVNTPRVLWHCSRAPEAAGFCRKSEKGTAASTRYAPGARSPAP